MKLQHRPVLLQEIINFLPDLASGTFLDVTAGGGGHATCILEAKANWRMECWDRDLEAQARIEKLAEEKKVLERLHFVHKSFSIPIENINPSGKYLGVLADLGVSSFQLDDMSRGMSFRSQHPVDMRMNTNEGVSFVEWVASQSLESLEKIFRLYAEETQYRKAAKLLKNADPKLFTNAAHFADYLGSGLYSLAKSKRHPATRLFQALRMAINHEMEQLSAFLDWAPHALVKGGRIMIISFHSLEDRVVKRRFQDLVVEQGFDILTQKALVPSVRETEENPRARSAKLRILERRV